MNKHLACSCCGDGFYGKQDPDHDEGFGTCEDCAVWIAQCDNDQWRRHTAQFAMSLNKGNRRKFLSMDTELQRGIICQALEDGIIKLVIKNRAAIAKARGES